MKKVIGRTFNDERIYVDDVLHQGCTFERCTLVYTATGPVGMSGCKLNDCKWAFEGAAAVTIRFMTDIYPVAPQLIEQTFENIRKGTHQLPPESPTEFPDTIL